MAKAARAGTESGTTIRQKIVKWSAPSMRAASNSSPGKVEM